MPDCDKNVDGYTIIVYKPIKEINAENKSTLQFLDLMNDIDRDSEVSGTELRAKLRRYVNSEQVDFSLVKKYLPLCSDKVYRNIYNGGLMCELV